jgi:hypothetical protein
VEGILDYDWHSRERTHILTTSRTCIDRVSRDSGRFLVDEP